MNRRARMGMTLLELMAALAAFSVLSGAALMYAFRAEVSADVREGTAQAELDARNLVDAMIVELRQSGLTCPDWSFSATSVTFNKAIAFDGDNVVWSPAITLSLTPVLGEALNGVDDNGNGLVDECSVRRVEAPTVPPAWTGYQAGPALRTYPGIVQTADLTMTINDAIITIDVTVSNPKSISNLVVSGRQITAVAMRN